MDMRVYYRKIHEIEAGLAEPVVVISLETQDGGKAGVPTEVARRNAAKLIVDGKGRLASEEEARWFQAAQAEAKRAADQLEAGRHLQVTLVTPIEPKNLKSGNRPTKD